MQYRKDKHGEELPFKIGLNIARKFMLRKAK